MTEQEILRQFNAPQGAILDKVFKNGNIKIKRKTTCSRCGNGNGIFYTHVCNGVPIPSHVDQGVCFKCLGSGWEWTTEILMTPENEAKAEQRRAKEREKQAEKQKEIDALNAQKEAERKAQEEAEAKARAEEEARIKAEKAMSNYRGNVGEKIDEQVTYLGSAHFEVKSFSGFGTETMYVHNFRDNEGNKLVWKTSTDNFAWKLNEETNEFDRILEAGQRVNLKGTIKAHNEYKEEKQTSVTRCKVTI